MGSRLRDAVLVDPDIVGDRAFYDQVDATAMSEVTNRHGDTEYTDTPHRRRMITPKTYEVADLVDRADRRRLLNDPINPYTRSMAAAANRTIDDVIIASFDATAATGVDGSGTADFPASGFDVTPAAQTLDQDDLAAARQILESNDNEEDDGDNKWFLVYSPIAKQFLLSETEVTSADYNTVRALVNGQIDTYLGFKFITSTRLSIASATGIRDCFAWVKNSMQLGMGQEPRSFMDVLPQKRHSIQVRHELDAGATRMDEKGVVRILVDEVA
jgi:hypothetical protein